MMESEVIKLQSYRKSESSMYSGREHGLEIRKELDLNKKDKDEKKYIIQISDDTIAINSSFFGGLFSDSVVGLGEERFKKKYIFQNNKGKEVKETIKKDIEEGIYDAING